MRQLLVGLSISLAFVAGAVFSQHAPSIVSSARAAGETGRWIYRCENLIPAGISPASAGADVVGKLNDLGRQGWELVLETDIRMSGARLYCFKQPLH
jgi:hypothetical protein